MPIAPDRLAMGKGGGSENGPPVDDGTPLISPIVFEPRPTQRRRIHAIRGYALVIARDLSCVNK